MRVFFQAKRKMQMQDLRILADDGSIHVFPANTDTNVISSVLTRYHAGLATGPSALPSVTQAAGPSSLQFAANNSPFPRDPNTLPAGNDPNYPWHPHWDDMGNMGVLGQWTTSEKAYQWSRDGGKTWFDPINKPKMTFPGSPNANYNPSEYLFRQKPTS
jgi:hypothetical protein